MAPPSPQLTSAYVFQLESRGQLRLAVYIAAVTQSKNSQQTTTTPLALELLCRYAPSLTREDFSWLHYDVGLPLCWLAYSRALAARHRGDAAAEAILLAETLACASFNIGAYSQPTLFSLLGFAARMREGLAPELDSLASPEAGMLIDSADRTTEIETELRE